MDAYAPSSSARRYQSPQSMLGSSAKLKLAAGSNLGSIGGSKVVGSSKPRASSASISRRGNSPAGALAGSGNFSFQAQQRIPMTVEGDGAGRSGVSAIGGLAYGGYAPNGANLVGGTASGAYTSDAGRADSYDQIRRNYELSRNGAVNATTLLGGGGGGAMIPRAQSASHFRPNATTSTAGNSAYQALRQQAAAMGYVGGMTGSSGDSASLLEGATNSMFPASALRSAVTGSAALNRLGLNGTRGVANGGNHNYNAGGGLQGLSVSGSFCLLMFAYFRA
jgi:hypothetical protein